MNKNTSLFIAIFLLCTSVAYFASAQSEADALRFSYLSPQSTARSMGFGSALGSIGGDMGSLSINPAGIGVYRSSEFTITPTLRFNNTSSKYQTTTTDDNNTRFTINNLGAVFTNSAKGRRYERSNWKSLSFGISVNRSADFNKNYTYSGRNNTSSGAELFEADANAYPGDINNTSTFAGLGYESFLVNYDSTIGAYKTVVDYAAGTNQKRIVEQRGGISDISFSFGGNYKEKLMIGATLGIPSLRYTEVATYSETDATNNPNNNFQSFTYDTDLTTTGTGVNLKLGFIYNITSHFRAGAAIHTPTYYAMSDIQNRSLSANTENLKAFSYNINSGPVTRVDAPTNEYQYGLLTPWRAVISAAGIIGKNGFITADYEYVNYASARYNFDAVDNDYEQFINQSIKNMYQGASNIRIGMEGRHENIMGRIGFGYYGNPYQSAAITAERYEYSAGVGFRFDSWFADLAYRLSQFEESEQPYYSPYVGVTVPTAVVQQTFHTVAMTIGFKF